MQAKDIDDLLMLRLIRRLADERCERNEGHEVNRWQIHEAHPEWPYKVMMAKLKALIKRKLITGCTCGCRGDFDLTESGDAFLAANAA